MELSKGRGDSETRRRFLKRTGGATAATVIAWHGTQTKMQAGCEDSTLPSWISSWRMSCDNELFETIDGQEITVITHAGTGMEWRIRSFYHCNAWVSIATPPGTEDIQIFHNQKSTVVATAKKLAAAAAWPPELGPDLLVYAWNDVAKTKEESQIETFWVDGPTNNIYRDNENDAANPALEIDTHVESWFNGATRLGEVKLEIVKVDVGPSPTAGKNWVEITVKIHFTEDPNLPAGYLVQQNGFWTDVFRTSWCAHPAGMAP